MISIVILILVGIAFVVISFILKGRKERLIQTGIPVEGIVFDFAPGNNNDSAHEYPIIRFVTLREEWITKVYHVRYPKSILKEGQKVAVYYNPDNPSDFVLALQLDKWILTLIMFAGIIFILGALIYLLLNFLSAK
jgi:Protein of unknown function (DUF3592)